MKKKKKIIIVSCLVLLLILGWFAYKNWNSIDAIVHSLNTTEEETVKEIEQTKEELSQYLETEENITVRELTEEESKALSEGTITEEEAIELMTGKKPAPEKTPEKEPSETNAPKPKEETESEASKPEKTPEESSGDRVSELIAKLYVEKSKYLNKLDSIEASVRAEYLSDPHKWESKSAAKKDLLKKYLPEVAAWEKTCDSTVYGILDEIRAELRKTGKDESIVDTMKKAYLEEKKLKKTYFINRYMD